jgi:NADP-dependent 3-hydroxy acid dehydrogenase YdfG
MRLSNKVVVVVGGGSGIGLAVAKQAHLEGASVVIVGRSSAKLEQAKSLIGEKVKAIVTDVMDESAINQAFIQIGTFDHLFISAQDASTALLSETTMERFYFSWVTVSLQGQLC